MIDYFGHLVEWTLTKLSDEERGWKNRVVAKLTWILPYKSTVH